MFYFRYTIYIFACLHDDVLVKVNNSWAVEPYDSCTVYRCPNNKWFALIMQSKFKNLGFESDEPVWAVNSDFNWSPII